MTRLLALLALLLGSPALADELVISFGGDVNFSRSRVAPLPSSVRKFYTVPLETTTEALAPVWAGSDVNFVNMESVVGDRDGTPLGKTFVFRSHPQQVDHLLDLGVNAFALANNHAWDHGLPGMHMTRQYFDTAAADRPILFAGIGEGDAAFAPRVVDHGAFRIAFAAMSFGGSAFPPGPRRIGMASLDNPLHRRAVLGALSATDADIRILSLHWGAENSIYVERGHKAFVEEAFAAGVNLVLGHHPHVARGVELRAESAQAAFYSLGNLLFIGGAEKDSKGLGQDYGMIGRAFFRKSGAGIQLTALDIQPLKGVHFVPRPMSPARAVSTISHLTRLSALSAPDTAAFFEAWERGGRMCLGGPFGPRARALCCAGDTSSDCSMMAALVLH